MKKIYEKLGLYHLSRAERVRNLFELYKPMFADEPDSRNYPRRKNPPRKAFYKRVLVNKEIEIDENEFANFDDENIREEMFENLDGITIEIEPEPEELTQEDEDILNEDESALVAYTMSEYNLTGGKPMQQKKKLRGVKVVLNLIIVGLAVFGAWQGWNYVKDLPILDMLNPNISTQREIDFVEAPTIAPTIAPTTFPTYTPYPTYTPLPTIAPTAIPTEAPVIAPVIAPTYTLYPTYTPYPTQKPTHVPTATLTDIPTPFVITELGEWYEEDGIKLKLVDYGVTDTSTGMNSIDFNFEIWNQSEKNLIFSWDATENFSLTDNVNNIYEIDSHSDNHSDDVIMAPGDREFLLCGWCDCTIAFDEQNIFKHEVTDLYLTVEYLSKIDKAVFHINLDK